MPEESKKLYAVNEGTIIVNRKASSSFSIAIQSAKNYDPSVDCKIVLDIHENEAKFRGVFEDQPYPFNQVSDHDEIKVGYENGKKVSYWFSFNRDDRELKYGKGYIMTETTLLTHTFKMKDEETIEEESEDHWADLFDVAKKKYFTVTGIDIPSPASPSSETPGCKSLQDTEETVNFYPYPLINNWPHLVKDSATATIFDIASNKYILSACLPTPCQDLYAMVASPSVNLDSELAEAIGCSLKEGELKKILDKKMEGSDGMSSYLRVTLGVDHGSSPGIPFILELWPTNSGSLIHNHGNAYGIVKVIHGEIMVQIYNKTWPKENDHEDTEPAEIGDPTPFLKGDVAWLSPNWYQTHRLYNLSGKDYCATIQCYKYGDDDNIKYPYFDYWDKSETEEFTPNSDLDFIEMVKLALEDYQVSKSKAKNDK